MEDEHIANDDSNRAFIQAFMARGSMTFKEARPVLAAIFTAQSDDNTVEPEEVTQEDFESYIGAARTTLSLFDYEIRSTLHQVSKDRIWALVNSTSDPMTQLATTRTAEEIAYIKRVIDAMFETYNSQRAEVMGVTSLQAMKVTKPGRDRQSINGVDGEENQSGDKGLTATQAEALLGSLVVESWFERSKEGWYTLSPRALMELKNWLIGTYNEPDAADDEWQRIKFCEACKEIVTVGQRCVEVDCNARLHDICHVSYWKTRRDHNCPKCKREWVTGHWVGEKAVTTREGYLNGRRRSGKKQLPVVEEPVVGEEEEEGDEGDEVGEGEEGGDEGVDKAGDEDEDEEDEDE